MAEEIEECQGACNYCGHSCQRARVADLESGLNEKYRLLAEQAISGVTPEKLDAALQLQALRRAVREAIETADRIGGKTRHVEMLRSALSESEGSKP